MRCPVCRIPTAPKPQSGLLERSCPRCYGIWVSQMALRSIMVHELANPTNTDLSLAELNTIVTGSESKATLYCPECHVALVKERVHPLVPVEVDRCEKCNYIWFDAGKQLLLLRLYRALMKSDDPQLTDQLAKLDRLEAVYKGIMPGMEKVDRDIAKIARGVVTVMESLNHAPLGPQLAANLMLVAVRRVVDWFVSLLIPDI